MRLVLDTLTLSNCLARRLAEAICWCWKVIFLEVGIHPWDKELPTPSSSLLTNRVRFGAEMRKIWPSEDNCSRLVRTLCETRTTPWLCKPCAKLTILPYWNMTSWGTICMDQPSSQHLHPCLTQMSQAKAPNPKQLQAPLPLKPSPPPQKPLQSPSSETWPISNCPYALFIWQFLKK